MSKDDKPIKDKMKESYAKGDAAGEEFAKDAGKAGANINKAGGGLIDTVKGWFSGDSKKKDASGKDEPEELDEHGKPKKSGIGAWFESLNAGGLIGGLLGVAGAWMVGSGFGGGIVGTVASVLLSLGGFFIGRKLGDEHINGWMGRPSSKDKEAGLAQVIEKGKGQPTIAATKATDVGQTATPAQVLTEKDKEDMVAIMAGYNSTYRGPAAAPATGFVAQNVSTAPEASQYTYGGRPITPVNARGV